MGDEFRERLGQFISEVIVELPASERDVVKYILNMGSVDKPPLPTKRMNDLADDLKVDPRTVRRKTEALFGKMADIILAGTWARDGDGHHGSGWYVELLDVVLRLDVEPMQSIERRTIVATRDGLEEVVNSVDLVPRKADPLSGQGVPRTEVTFGAVAGPDDTISGVNLQSRIMLPRRLAMGERHTYGVVITSTPTAPHYVCIPLRRFNRFRLTVRFDQRHLPSTIWALDGVTSRQIDLRQPSDVLLAPDRAGEVARSFDGLRRGVAYGIQWLSMTSEAG